MKEEKIVVGVIGLGMGKGHLKGAIACGAEVGKICDPDTEKMANVAKELGVDASKCCTDYKEVLADPTINTVIIATPDQLHNAFRSKLRAREAKEGQSYECFPDIPFEEIMAELFRDKGIPNADALGVNAAQLFRISSLEYIRLYPGALEALAKLRQKGCRLWLLSNAQRIFTEYELRHLGLGEQLDAISISVSCVKGFGLKCTGKHVWITNRYVFRITCLQQ